MISVVAALLKPTHTIAEWRCVGGFGLSALAHTCRVVFVTLSTTLFSTLLAPPQAAHALTGFAVSAQGQNKDDATNTDPKQLVNNNRNTPANKNNVNNKPNPNAQQAERQQAGAQREREEVRKELQSVQKAIAETQNERRKANRALAAIDKQLSDTNKRIQTLNNERRDLETQITDLSRNETQLSHALKQTEERLARVMRNQYKRLDINPTQSWLGGQAPGQAARESYWYERISKAERDLAELQLAQRQDLEAVREGLEEKKNQLQTVIEKQNNAKEDLAAQKAERGQIVADINSKLSSQELQRKRLQRDETRLAAVIQQLARAIERAKQQEAEEQRRRMERERQFGDSPRKGGRSKNEGRERTPTMPAFTGEFAKRRGQLELPVKGTILGRFGSTRSRDGQGPTWKGLFIATQAGQSVRVVAPGRVVFSDWMRGFGELVIVDHGDEYLSVYGNNEKRLKRVGDVVNTGEAVALTGNSSGNLDNGLYFELRRQGIAFDPIPWTRGQ